jgi:hypothetical protein
VKDEHEGVEGGQEELNLSADRNIDVNEDAIAVAEVDALEMGEGSDYDSIDRYWKKNDFDNFDRGKNKDWSAGYRADGETFLTEVSSQYYKSLQSGHHVQPMKHLSTDKPPTASPENAKGFAQTFLVALTLHALKLNNDNPGNAEGEKIPNFNVFAQGNPGSGKTFIQMTLLNVVRTVCQKMAVAQSIAPTGCAASLLSGTTTNRFCKLPQGKQLFETPCDKKWFKPNDVTIFKKQMETLLMVLIDETSMLGRCDFAWIGHRFREGRQNLKGCKHRTFGGIPIRMLFQDLMQLPAVLKKSLTDVNNAKPHHRACAIGLSEFSDYLRPKADSADVPVVLVMDAVFRQANSAFKDVLQQMRDGTLDKKALDYLNKRRWSNLSQDEKNEFWRDGIFLMPTWARTVPIVKQYLKDLGNALVVVEADVTNVKRKAHLKDFSWPMMNPLMAGADVQLLHNFFVEAHLFNGTVGKLVAVVYKPGDSPNSHPPAMPAYVEVSVPGLKFPNGEVWDVLRPDVVPIPPCESRCEAKCCSIYTVPLRVHKASTIHKAQGITVGKDCPFKKVVCGFGGKATGSELVAVSRAQEPTDFVIYDVDPLDNYQILRIGKGAGCDAKRKFCDELLDLQATTIPPVMDLIAQHDSADDKTYAGVY